MKQAYVHLPVLTGDVSGVCSVLYELGGMVVMHDPSGCNSTYNTHDEIRWYNQPSLIFLSGLKASDAIMGNDDKLVHDVVKAARLHQPRFIALCNSPIPYIIGTDFAALSTLIENETHIPTFYIQTNAMHDYVRGGELALEKIVSLYFKRRLIDDRHIRVNIIGSTPLDYTNVESIESLKTWLNTHGFIVNANMTFPSDFDQLIRIGEADVNLVISSLGYKAALWMARQGIPYVVGLPVPGMEDQVEQAIHHAVKTKENIIAYQHNEDVSDTLLIGDAVVMSSLAFNMKGRVICPSECHDDLLNQNDVRVDGEEDLVNHLGQPEIVIGDPMYRYYCDDSIQFIELPHFALSGRLYQKRIPDLMTLQLGGTDDES